MTMITLLQRAQTAAPEPAGDWVDSLLTFLDTPLPYSPATEYLLVLFILWLMARRHDEKKIPFEKQAQDVLDQKLESGELSPSAYEKFRQDMALRPKR